MEYQATICNRCGTSPDDWLDDRGEAAEPPPYIAKSVRCLGCATLDEARAKVGKDDATSVQHRLVRVPKRIGMRELQTWQMNKSK